MRKLLLASSLAILRVMLVYEVESCRARLTPARLPTEAAVGGGEVVLVPRELWQRLQRRNQPATLDDLCNELDTERVPAAMCAVLEQVFRWPTREELELSRWENEAVHCLEEAFGRVVRQMMQLRNGQGEGRAAAAAAAGRRGRMPPPGGADNRLQPRRRPRDNMREQDEEGRSEEHHSDETTDDDERPPPRRRSRSRRVTGAINWAVVRRLGATPVTLPQVARETRAALCRNNLHHLASSASWIAVPLTAPEE